MGSTYTHRVEILQEKVKQDLGGVRPFDLVNGLRPGPGRSRLKVIGYPVLPDGLRCVELQVHYDGTFVVRKIFLRPQNVYETSFVRKT